MNRYVVEVREVHVCRYVVAAPDEDDAQKAAEEQDYIERHPADTWEVADARVIREVPTDLRFLLDDDFEC